MFGWLDAVLTVIFVVSMISGYMRGFARLGIGAAVTFLGILFAIAFYGVVGSFFLPYVSAPGIAHFLGFVTILIAASLGGSLLGRLMSRVFKSIGLGWLDRLLGMGVGAVRALLIAVAIVMALVSFTPNPPAKSVVESSLAPYVLDAARVLVAIAPRELRDGFFRSYENIKDKWEHALRDGSKVLDTPRAQHQ